MKLELSLRKKLISFDSLLVSAIVVFSSFSACKPRGVVTGSQVQSDINFNSEKVALDSYIANEQNYAGLKLEFAAIAANNNGKPNYGDGEAKIKNDLKPVFSTLPSYSMRMEEQVALLVWTVGNIGQNPPFERINRALRSPEAADDAEIHHTVKVLSSALNKLRGQSCNAVRGVRGLPDSYISLSPGETFKDNGFVAFGMGAAPPKPFDQFPIYIYVTSPKCKVISEFSKFGAEKEVLFPPGSDFTVTSNRMEGTRRVFRLAHDGGPAPGAVAGGGGAGPVGGPMIGGGAAAGGGEGGAVAATDFVGSKFRDPSGRTLWLNSGRACSAKPVSQQPKTCTWEFVSPDRISITFQNNTTWHYKAKSKDAICFTGEGQPGANCIGEMTRYQ